MLRRIKQWLGPLGILLITIPAQSADSSEVVVRVGKRSMTLLELEQRWQTLPAFQQKALGESTAARVRAYVERWIVPEMLLAQAPFAGATAQTPGAQRVQQGILQQALADRVKQQLDHAQPISAADIKQYFESHRELFERPLRLRLFRILLGDEASAKELIATLKGAPDFDRWRNAAREKSVDHATNMRGGELGFVSADGRSDMVELQVDPALFAAATHLKDGELAKEPIREGDKFAVLWRRGHVAAEAAQLDTAREVIATHLRQARAQARVESMLTSLRSQYVKDVKPELLEILNDIPAAPVATSAAATTEDAK